MPTTPWRSLPPRARARLGYLDVLLRPRDASTDGRRRGRASNARTRRRRGRASGQPRGTKSHGPGANVRYGDCEDRAVRDPRCLGRGRNGHRVRVLRRPTRSPSGVEVGQGRGDTGSPRPDASRSAGPRQAQPSQCGPRVRGGRTPRPRLHRDGVRAGVDAAAVASG